LDRHCCQFRFQRSRSSRLCGWTLIVRFNTGTVVGGMTYIVIRFPRFKLIYSVVVFPAPKVSVGTGSGFCVLTGREYSNRECVDVTSVAKRENDKTKRTSRWRAIALMFWCFDGHFWFVHFSVSLVVSCRGDASAHAFAEEAMPRSKSLNGSGVWIRGELFLPPPLKARTPARWQYFSPCFAIAFGGKSASVVLGRTPHFSSGRSQPTA